MAPAGQLELHADQHGRLEQVQRDRAEAVLGRVQGQRRLVDGRGPGRPEGGARRVPGGRRAGAAHTGAGPGGSARVDESRIETEWFIQGRYRWLPSLSKQTQ